MGIEADDIAALTRQRADLGGACFVAKGGQKNVYSAIHPKHGRVAVKVFVPDTDVDRAEREVQAVRAIQCDTTPRIYETFVLETSSGARLALTEQWIDGASLRDVLGARGALEPKFVLQLAQQVSGALVEAERLKIVHRDIKPENILVAPAGDCFLLDFGIARHLQKTALTATGQGNGLYTPGYAPPEQFLNIRSDIDSRADVFALGVTLFECVEGVNPFRTDAKDVGEVLRRVQGVALDRIARPLGDGGDLAGLIFAMTRPALRHRLRSMAEVHDWANSIKISG